MKLLRFGEAGVEKPGIMDTNGTIRDLSSVLTDIAGDALSDEGITRIAAIDPTTLPSVDADTRLGPCVCQSQSKKGPSRGVKLVH